MTENLAFKKALACLSHPFSIGAILLLFLNDHLLRHLWPSWWTGKLGDFAWLFFFPFFLAACLAWILPRRLPHHQWWVGGLAFGLVGGIFVLAKTQPFFHGMLIHILDWVLGFPVSVQRDATDLVALLSLIVGLWLWLKIKSFPEKKFRPGFVLLASGVFLTIANMPQPDPGIYCLDHIGEEIVACASYSCYGSTDGGLNWAAHEGVELSDCPSILSEETPVYGKVAVPAQSGVTYWFTPGGDIQRSEEADSPWKVEYQIIPVSQAQKTYYFKTHTGNPVLTDSPQDGIYDPASGNVIFTMGHEGVLVRQAQGSYKLVQVGSYGKVRTTQLDVLVTVLTGEFGLAACFGGLVVVLLGFYEERSLLKKLVSVLAVVVWLFPVFFVPPALSAGSYAAALSSISILVAGLLIFPLALDGFFMVGILAPDSLLRLGLLVVAGILLFLLPYVLWGLNLLPDYRLATVSAMILGGGFILYQYRSLMSGTSSVKPEVSSQVEPRRLIKAGWLFLGGAVLSIVGIALTLFGLNIGLAGVVVGLVLMLGGVWVRRKVWIAARKDEVEQESSDQVG